MDRQLPPGRVRHRPRGRGDLRGGAPGPPRQAALHRSMRAVVVSRLARVLRSGRTALALALAAGSLALSACGGDEGGTIPQANADALLQEVENLEQNVETGQCSLATASVDRLRQGIDDLPKEVGIETKSGLFDLVDRLQNLVDTQCEPVDTGPTGETGVKPTTTSTTTTTTETEEEPPPEEEEDEGNEGSGGGQGPEGTGPPGQSDDDSGPGSSGGTSGGTEG